MLTRVDEQIWRFKGKGSGAQRIGIVGGMHGDEPEGIRLVRALCASTHPFWIHCPHEVVLIMGHPAAIATGRREGPDGGDLNRAFGPSEGAFPATEARASAIRQALEGVEVVLDLHQTHLPIAPCAVCPATPAHLELAGQLGAVQAVTGTQGLYGDGMLGDWVNAQGHLGLTLESGQVGQEAAYFIAKEAVRRLLLAPEDRPKAPLQQVWEVHETLPAPGADYRFVKALSNGSRVQEGELLATSADGNLHATATGAIFLPRLGKNPGEPCCVQVRGMP
jgi:predicted deacylase